MGEPQKSQLLDARDYAAQTILVCGRQLVADRSGVLYWPGERLLIVSDLHLEKGSYFAAKGQLIPPYDSRETLMRLAKAVEQYDPDTIISLGDSFHDPEGPTRLGEAERRILRLIQEGRDWIWVAGNHDATLAEDLGGELADSLTVSGLTLRHAPTAGRATHEIAGHLHPTARLAVHGVRLRRSCFVGNGHRLIMPAFGAYTGGLNVLDPAFDPLFGDGGFSIWMRGEDGLYPVSTRQICSD